MDKPDTTLEIQTLGRFRICIEGKPVATAWPDETLKVFFCSLLSPLDLYFAWDRICRSMWDVPETGPGRRRLDEKTIQPLGMFLVKELGFNPLVVGSEGIRLNQQRIHVDARTFYDTVHEGLHLSSLADHSAALKKFTKANALYTGSFLPGIVGKIIENARHDLDAMHHTAVKEAILMAQNSGELKRYWSICRSD
jgi:hypothetical protein